MEKKITFSEFKEHSASDCEFAAKKLTELAAQIREGNTEAFEQFWYTDGTKAGDAKIFALRELMCLRYFRRKELVQ